MIATVLGASALTQNDILCSVWGWEQTNADFYQVLRSSNGWVVIRQLQTIKTRTSDMTGTVVPQQGVFDPDSPELRKKIKHYHSGPGIKLTAYANAYRWDGKPQSFSDYA